MLKLEENLLPADLPLFGETLATFSLPRWEELPDFELYMDQVVTLINRYLQPILPEKNNLTAAMVNNYVKQKIIAPPVKKHYTKEHLAYLLIITLFKQVLSLPEVKKALGYQINLQEIKEGYDNFCQQQEQAFREIAEQMKQPKNVTLPFSGEEEKMIFLRSITLALALKIFSQSLLKSPLELKGEGHE